METEYLEGKHALAEALEAHTPLHKIYISGQVAADKRCAPLLDQARQQGIDIERVSKHELDARSVRGAHQGIVAEVAPYEYAALHDLVQAAAGAENALIIATDHVTDAGNFGAIARSAEVVGACGLLIPNKRNAQVNAIAYKTSAGAVAHLPIAREANLVRSLESLKKEGFWIVGASQTAPQNLWDASLAGRIVLVVGSEGEGLSRLCEETCDLLVSLPQAGKVASLNVAQATCAIAYEWMRQCNAT